VPDSAALDTAILAKLQGDATLAAILTDGIYFDVAASGKTRFGIVSLSTDREDYAFDGSIEESVYIVKAVVLDTSPTSAKTAAARIHTLLQNTPLTVTGFDHLALRRTERIRYTEVDAENNDIRWQHSGGRYEAWVSS
jgi:hypothetical protein